MGSLDTWVHRNTGDHGIQGFKGVRMFIRIQGIRGTGIYGFIGYRGCWGTGVHRDTEAIVIEHILGYRHFQGTVVYLLSNLNTANRNVVITT